MTPVNPSAPKGGCLRAAGGALSLGVVVLIVLAVIEAVLVGAGGLLIAADPLEKADAVAVLSGGGNVRLEEGARLYEDGYAQYIILTETGATLSDGSAYNMVLKLELMDRGIPNGAILETEKHAQTTIEEAQALRKLLVEKNFKTCIIVTDPYHTFRTRQIFKTAFQSRDIRIIVRPARGHWYRATTWYLSSRGWKTTLLEYAKLLNFYLQLNND